MIDYEPVDVGPLPVQTTSPKPQPKTQPKKVKLEHEPKPAIPDPPANVDTSRITESSKAFAAQSTAKLLVILTNVIAFVGKSEPIAMTDEEAIAIAIPGVTILLRIKAVQELFKDYGQYFLSLDEYVLLGVAIFAYYNRVEKELGRKKVQDESVRSARQEQAFINPDASNGYGGAPQTVTPAWRK